MAFWHDIPVVVSLANLSHNPPFAGAPESVNVPGYLLKPWFNFNRGEMINSQFGDVIRFILRASDYTFAKFPLGGYVIWDDGHIKWAFRWDTVVPWSVDADGDPDRYLFVCQKWTFIDS
jgi:hypothetical protein